MKKTIIAAKSDNDVIGRDQELAWELPADQHFFFNQIRDCFLLTGRASFESPQGKDIFANRDDVIIVTRQKKYRAGEKLVAHSVREAFRRAEAAGAERLCILGGGEIYRQTIDLADELIITEIHAQFEGDTYFPPIDPQRWEEDRREDYAADQHNPFAYSFVFYKRRFID